MGLKDRLRRIRRKSEEDFISIPQQDGTARRFPPTALGEAFLKSARHLRGEDVEPHALNEAAENSSDATWRDSFYSFARIGPGYGREPRHEVEDFSE